MHLLAHAASQFMMLLGKVYLLSVPMALLSALLLGWPRRRSFAKWLAFASLVISLPVLGILPFLPSVLGGDAAGVVLLLLVSPCISAVVLIMVKRLQKG
ncbi:hypothetical protein [Prosthecobacter fluviatilis]|uniref:Uncharacterized protein n=1 Tax=Prosthecobacter fluviatilis TaxID=445931 RepID=A0ABW0KRJ9_9BACT